MRANLTVYPARPQGAAMIVVLMFIMVCTIVFTAWLHLLAARTRQVEGMMDSAQRHIAWTNMEGIQQQYAYSWALRDKLGGADNTGSTRVSSEATPVSGWGGITAAAWTSLKAFRSTNRAAGGTSAYPFNNIDPLVTPNQDVYFERISAVSDTTQSQSVSMFGYLKTYPTTLLGDLFIVHRRPSGVSSFYLSDNIQVNGRVVVRDEIAEVGNVRALSCLNMTKTGTNTADNTAASAPLMPLNLPTTLRITDGGYGAALSGTGSATSVANGTLNLVNNANFAPGSVYHNMTAAGNLGWIYISRDSARSGTASQYQKIDTDSTSGDSSSMIEINHDTSGTAPSPYNQSMTQYNPTNRLNVAIVRLKYQNLVHVYIHEGIEKLQIEGSTVAAAADYSPVIICIDQPNLMDIRFVGENNRRFILAQKGSGQTVYCDFPSNVSDNVLDWRMHWINENCRPYIDIDVSDHKVSITGSMRTDRDVNFIPSGSDARVIFGRETSPDGNVTDKGGHTLEELLPRDGWIEPYFIAQ